MADHLIAGLQKAAAGFMKWATKELADDVHILKVLSVDATGAALAAGGSTTTNAAVRTITVGGTAQDAFIALAARSYLFVQNPLSATESLYVNDGANAAADTTSWELQPGEALEFGGSAGFVPVGRISVVAATTSHAFIAKEA